MLIEYEQCGELCQIILSSTQNAAVNNAFFPVAASAINFKYRYFWFCRKKEEKQKFWIAQLIINVTHIQCYNKPIIILFLCLILLIVLSCWLINKLYFSRLVFDSLFKIFLYLIWFLFWSYIFSSWYVFIQIMFRILWEGRELGP